MRFKVREGDFPERDLDVVWAPRVIEKMGGWPWRTIGLCAVGAFLLIVTFLGGAATGGGGCAVPQIKCDGPGPRPTPPAPTPPQPVGMACAVLVYETSADSTTANVWNSKEVQDYLTAKVPAKSRLIDQHADVSEGPEWVKAAIGIPRPSVPILVVQDVKGQWYTLPWPKVQAEAVAMLKKAGG